MEFFADTDVRSHADTLQRRIRVAELAHWCASIDTVLSHQGEKGRIYCLWGEFAVHREVLRDGVRFTLPGCPNALQWSLTVDGGGHGPVRVHCTINRADADPDFVASIECFVADWRRGLERLHERTTRPPAGGDASCTACYG